MQEITLAHARELFDMRANDTLELLQTRYRDLLKKYHPDSHQENKEFYTIMTRRINQAYQLLSVHLRNIRDNRHKSDDPPPDSSASSDNDAPHPRNENDDRYRGFHRSHPLIIAHEYHPYIDTMSNAICHYYSYDLSNTHLRDGGSSRTHYKMIRHTLQKLLSDFDRSIQMNDDYDSDVQRYFLFCESFFDNLQSELRIRTRLNATGYKLLRIYREYTQVIDSAIERRYCVHEEIRVTFSTEELFLARYNFEQLTLKDARLGFHDIASVKHRLVKCFLDTMHWEYSE